MPPRGLYSPWNSPGQNTGVGSLSLSPGDLPTRGLNPGLPHCRRILHKLSHKGSPLTGTKTGLSPVWPSQHSSQGLVLAGIMVSCLLMMDTSPEQDYGLSVLLPPHSWAKALQGVSCSVAQSYGTLCDPMDCGTPDFPVLHYLPEFVPTHVPSRGCHPSISSSVVPFSSCLQSLPASGSFPTSQLFASDGQSIGVETLREMVF